MCRLVVRVMSKKRGETPQEKLDNSIRESVKKADKHDLAKLLIDELGYPKQEFETNTTSKLRSLAIYILQRLKLPSLTQLQKMSHIVRLAALYATDVPPPAGAAVFFEV